MLGEMLPSTSKRIASVSCCSAHRRTSKEGDVVANLAARRELDVPLTVALEAAIREFTAAFQKTPGLPIAAQAVIERFELASRPS